MTNAFCSNLDQPNIDQSYFWQWKYGIALTVLYIDAFDVNSWWASNHSDVELTFITQKIRRSFVEFLSRHIVWIYNLTLSYINFLNRFNTCKFNCVRLLSTVIWTWWVNTFLRMTGFFSFESSACLNIKNLSNFQIFPKFPIFFSKKVVTPKTPLTRVIEIAAFFIEHFCACSCKLYPVCRSCSFNKWYTLTFIPIISSTKQHGENIIFSLCFAVGRRKGYFSGRPYPEPFPI